MKYININKSMIPYEFELNLDNETFQFELFYNTKGDFFTVNLYKSDIPILYGEKLVYGVPLFDNREHLEVPNVIIYPYDVSKTKKDDKITYDNLNEDVFLYVLD